MMSVLIPWRPDGGWREMLASWVARRYDAMGFGSPEHPGPRGEIVWGSDDHEDEVFSSARALNRAFAASSGKVLFLVGADTVPDLVVIRRSLRAIAAGAPWVSPWQRTFFATEPRTARLMDDPSETFRLGALDIAQRLAPGNVVSQCSGPTICTREAWERVGGQDERFRGWGPEDMAFRMRLQHVYGEGVAVNVAPALHLWHPVREYSSDPAEAEAKRKAFELWDGEYGGFDFEKANLDETIRHLKETQC